MYGMADGESTGERIRLARQRKHLTREQFAKRVGKSVRAVYDWEKDLRSPKNSQGAIEEVLEISLYGDGTQELPPLVRDNWHDERVRVIWELGFLPPETRLGYIVQLFEPPVEREEPEPESDEPKPESA